MKTFLQIASIFLILIGCSQLDNSKRNSDTVYIDEEKVKINSSGQEGLVEFQSDTSYVPNQKIKDLSGEGIVQIIENPIETIDSIFNDYIQYHESTDSEEDKQNLTLALNQLDTKLTVNELVIILNVWMYYDPTDFPTRKLTEKVLSKNRQKSMKAIRTRMDNKKEWESEKSAPYSELNYLLEKVKKTEYNNK